MMGERVTLTRTPSDVFTMLCMPKRVLTAAVKLVLQTAFDQGAYVCGGAARMVINSASSQEDIERLHMYVRPGPIRNRGRFWRSDRGDVDLFFPSKPALTEFWRTINDHPRHQHVVERIRSISGSSVDMIVDSVIVSVIEGFVGPVEDVLNRFDIYNAMVAFNHQEIIVPEGWHALEDEKMLHVANWTTPYVIHRINKWFWKHGMKKLSPKTASELGEQALQIMSRLSKEPIVMPWGTLTANSVVPKLKVLLPHLNNEELVKLVSIYPIDAYDGAFDILRRRGSVPA